MTNDIRELLTTDDGKAVIGRLMANPSRCGGWHYIDKYMDEEKTNRYLARMSGMNCRSNLDPAIKQERLELHPWQIKLLQERIELCDQRETERWQASWRSMTTSQLQLMFETIYDKSSNEVCKYVKFVVEELKNRGINLM